ncbi:hypothetical protein FO519_005588 [Halicephalobus sp. NKZ332]|nr:hypothetical protein FO519_005588 [Halicephalobus sp. NKZ332]
MVQIACSRNPTLSFCGEDKAAEEKKLEGLVQPLPNLPTFQEELIRSLENSTVKIEEKSIEEVEETLDISSKNETSEASEAPEDFEDEGIPDDPILEEPIPGSNSSELGSVLPLLAYCEQFLENYVKICNPNVKRNKKGREFCKAYDQFCVPPPTPEDLLKSTQDLVKCDEIVAEARKVCNPFPQPSDRLNHLRCTQFFKFCGKFVDWL